MPRHDRAPTRRDAAACARRCGACWLSCRASRRRGARVRCALRRASGCARTARARCRGCARGCPRCGLPTHRGRAARRRTRRSRGRGRRWPTRASRASSSRALKFRGALPVADLMAAHMAANLPADAARRRRPCSCPSRPLPARRRARGFDPGARAGRRARARGSSGRSRTASCARDRAAPPGRRGPRASARARPPTCACAAPAGVRGRADVHTTGATLDAAPARSSPTVAHRRRRDQLRPTL